MTEVECPYEGTLVEWVTEPNSVLPIGTEVARMEVAEGVREMPVEHGGQPPAPHREPETRPPQSRPRRVWRPGPVVCRSPRARESTFAKKGCWTLPIRFRAAGGKLMPEDVDRYLAAGSTTPDTTTATEPCHRTNAAPNAADAELSTQTRCRSMRARHDRRQCGLGEHGRRAGTGTGQRARIRQHFR